MEREATSCVARKSIVFQFVFARSWTSIVSYPSQEAVHGDDLREQMEGRTWLADRANVLIDEIPSAYKDIDEVMAAQADLVEVVAVLRQVLNYKGT